MWPNRIIDKFLDFSIRGKRCWQAKRSLTTGFIWQHLYFSRYPLSYEETRETNPLDFLLSGILAAYFVNITNPDSVLPKTEDRNAIFSAQIKRLIDEKGETRYLVFNHSFRVEQYIDIYEKMLQRPVIQPERKSRRQLP